MTEVPNLVEALPTPSDPVVMSATPRSFRTFCFGLGIATVALAASLAATSRLPDAAGVLILAALFAFAENASVQLPNESSLSASLMLAMTSIVVFAGDAPLLGPLLVAAAGSVYWPQLRNREWAKLAFNLGNFGISALAAAAVYSALPVDPMGNSVIDALLAAIPTSLTYASVNSILLMSAVAMMTGRPIRAVAREMWIGDAQILPFAVLGVLLGSLYLDLGVWIVPLFVAPILIARQAFASYLALRRAHDAALSTLVRVLEVKDHYTAGHVERVAQFAEMIGAELGLRPRRLEALRYAALMHDIGKLVVPNQILRKPGRLTSSEYERMRRHEAVSVELLRRIKFLAPIAPKLDIDLSSESDAPVSIEAQIVAVADAFDAMTSTRAYRKALTQDVAFAELREKVGSQFDEQCVEALIRVVEAGDERFGAGFETDVTAFDVTPPVAGTGSAGLGDLESDEPGVRS